MTDTNADIALTPAEKPARSLFLDALRGFAIVLVVLGHVVQRSYGIVNWFEGGGHLPKTYVNLFLFSFGYWHMPLFMGISGYLTFGHIKSPVGQWLRRKAALLLVPFLAWMTVYYWVPDRFIVKGKSFIDYVGITASNPGNGLWYLVVLFVFYTLAVMAESTGAEEWALLVIGIGITAMPTRSLVGVDQMQIVWWWFALGYVAAKYQERWFRWRFYIGVAAAVVYPVALYWLIHFRAFELLTVVKATGIIGSTLLVWLIVRLGAGRPFAFLGRRTLEIYAAQFLFASLPIWSGVARIGVVTVVAIVGSLAVAWVLRLNPITDALFLGGRHRASDFRRPWERAKRADETGGDELLPRV